MIMIDNKTHVIELQKMPVGGSDITLKTDITLLQHSLKRILALSPVSWHWKAAQDGTDLQYGFVAQEVEKVLPELVSKAKWRDGTVRKHIAYTDMIPYLVSAIKEQQEEIASLKKTVDSIKHS
jgi:hypothetical protein